MYPSYILRLAEALPSIDFIILNDQTEQGGYAKENGFYDAKSRTIGIYLGAGRLSSADVLDTAMFQAGTHEVVHDIKADSSEKFLELRDAVRELMGADAFERAVSRRYEQYKANDPDFTRADAEEEVVANALEDILNSEQQMFRLAKGHKNIFSRIWQGIKDFFDRVFNAIGKFHAQSGESQLLDKLDKRYKKLEKTFIDILHSLGTETNSAEENLAENKKEDQSAETEKSSKKSLKGVHEDGVSIYESNFPAGTPKAAKSKRILEFIQNVWSKKPIKLTLSNGQKTRNIYAQFDPTFDESDGAETDARKIAGGNKKGGGEERRVTLDLADDYYDIASNSTYDYSKLEIGKDSKTHVDVIMWHYFISNIYFTEYGSSELKPYTVTINVKERESGDFVYSFSAKKEFSTRRTLDAGVSTYKGTNGELFFADSISQKEQSVNRENEGISKNVDTDVKKSLKDTSSIESREAIVRSFGELAATDGEKKIVKDYAKSIERIDKSIEKKKELFLGLQELKGKTDSESKAQREKYSAEIQRINDEITKADESLLKIAAAEPFRNVVRKSFESGYDKGFDAREGYILKTIAKHSHSRYYNKKDVAAAIEKAPKVDTLTHKRRGELADELTNLFCYKYLQFS